MSTRPKRIFTEQEYLALDDASEFRHEFYQGEIFAMGGAGREHGIVVINLSAILVGQLKGRPCQAFATDMRVRVESTGLYTYPDLVVICGHQQFAEGKHTTLLNPTAIIEVLSPSTESYDRGKKFEHYRTLDSLSDYLLVAQDRPHVEHFQRDENGSWSMNEYNNRSDSVFIPSIDCRLPLAEIYDKVEFPTSRLEAPESGIFGSDE